MLGYRNITKLFNQKQRVYPLTLVAMEQQQNLAKNAPFKPVYK